MKIRYIFFFLVANLECIIGQVPKCYNSDTNHCFIVEAYPSLKFTVNKIYKCSDEISVVDNPLLADMDGDCVPEFIVEDRFEKAILIIDTKTGNTKWRINTPFKDFSPGSMAVADLDNDESPEIFFKTGGASQYPLNIRQKLMCYNSDGSMRWISDQRYDVNFGDIRGKLALADFNQDGIPEIYVNNKIFNAQTGNQLADGGTYGVGKENSEEGNFGPEAHSIAAQLDDDLLDLELAAGYTIYKVKINNTNGIAGNTMTARNILVDSTFRDGHTTVSDINSDGVMDVIVSSPGKTNKAILYAYTLASGIPKLISKAYPPSFEEFISPPFIGDIKGIGKPYIIISRASMLYAYSYNGSNLLQQEWSLITTDSSGGTVITMFDFNSDGKNEIVYRDETHLRILDASNVSPNELVSIPCYSITGLEYPMIGDIDNTGHAKICIPCSLLPDEYTGKLTIFGSPDSLPGWAPARGIWNQYNYHVLNINDDLTVPRVQKNNATYKDGKYNNFFVQESLLEDGKYRKKAANLTGTIKCINYDPIANEYSILFDIYNRADASFHADSSLPVSFYQGDPANGGTLLGTYFTTKSLVSGDSLVNLVYTFSAIGLADLFMVINTTRDTSGTFDPKDYTILECDYTDNLFRTMELPLVEKRNVEICSGSSYSFYDSSLTVAGTYHHSFQNRNGCDSLVTILQLQTTDTVVITETAVACDEYHWNGIKYTQSGQYLYDTTGRFGCDSITVLQLTIHHSSDTMIEQKACDRYTWHGHTYDSSGRYVTELIDRRGCDSTLTLALEVHYSDSVLIQHTSCKEYLWRGVSITQSGSYGFDTINRFGCDSTTVLQLEIVPVIQSNESQTACDGYIWNGTHYTQSGTYTFQSKSHLGCDSITSLHLTVHPTKDTMIAISHCDRYPWNGMTFDESGTYPYVARTSKGCDSTITLQLTIRKSTQSTFEIRACDQYPWNGKIYDQSGSYQYRTQNAAGCDSTATLNLVINPSNEVIIQQTACDSLRWNNLSYDQSGSYKYQTINSNGCDSTVHLELTIHQSSSENLTMSVCDSLMYLGKVLKLEGKYVYVLQDIHGCDSTIHLNLEILSENQTEQASACDSFRWDRNGITYEQSGIHTEKYINRFGCDSIHSIALNIHPSYRNQQNIEACKEYYWPVRQTRLTKTGAYTERLRTVQGCDSLIGLQLTIHPEYERTDTVTSKTAYIWPVNKQRYEKTGSYQQVYTSVYGCDSTHKLVLVIKEDVGIYAPNVIQPGGINGGFIIFDNGYTIHNIRTLSIYDRWGNLIWQKQNLEANKAGQGWDGRVQGQNAMPGVYVWIAELELEDGSLRTERGDVTVLR